jgi:hypothetical protein
MSTSVFVPTPAGFTGHIEPEAAAGAQDPVAAADATGASALQSLTLNQIEQSHRMQVVLHGPIGGCVSAADVACTDTSSPPAHFRDGHDHYAVARLKEVSFVLIYLLSCAGFGWCSPSDVPLKLRHKRERLQQQAAHNTVKAPGGPFTVSSVRAAAVTKHVVFD